MSDVYHGHPVKRTIDVTGMSCAGCEQTISKVLRDLPGVLEVRPNYQRGRVDVTYDLQTTRMQSVEDALTAIGYPPGGGFWARTKRDWARYLEQNQRDNLTHRGHCCSKPPTDASVGAGAGRRR